MILLFRQTRQVPVALLGRWLGISRTAVYKACEQWDTQNQQAETITEFVKEHRQINKKMSGTKLHILFKNSVRGQAIKIGRDRFYEVMREHNLILRKPRRRKPGNRHLAHIKMENLTKGLDLIGPNHLIVSDDTEVKCLDGKGYLSLVTDAYSHKVMGYDWSKRANSAHVSRAMKMAMNQHRCGLMNLIHHSDRGSIYISKTYQGLLGRQNIRTSFSPPGSPQCNPIAERINGIIKNEYLCHSRRMSFEQIASELQRFISHYNAIRPHMSCDMKAPEVVHRGECKPKKRWKGRKASYDKGSQPSVPSG